MLYFKLVQDSDFPHVAKCKAVPKMRISPENISKIQAHWFEKKELRSTSGGG
ncbi:unnamed protein product [Sphacelaria rigidula]